MASPAAVLSVLVQAEGLQRTTRQLQGFHGDLGKAGKAGSALGDSVERGAKKGSKALSGLKLAAGALAGVGVVTGLKTIVSASSDLGEQINKTKVVFRGSEKSILSWSKTTAKSLGISRREALEATGTFGNMLVPMGFARKKAGEMSKSMVNLSSDMASFNNANPKDVLEALRSGLAGETEPLRKFGVFLNDARLKTEALKLGLKDPIDKAGNLTAAAKAAATYSIILKDTKDAQGDFGRTSGGLANQLRIVRARGEDLAAKIGGVLVPAVSAALAVVLDLGNTVKKVTGFFSDHQAIILPVAAAIGVFALAYTASLIPALIASTAVIYAQVAAWVALKVAFLTSPVGLVVVALAALAAALVVAYRESETFRKIVNAAWAVIKTVAAWLITAGVAAFKAVASAVTVAWGVVKTVTMTVWNAVKVFLVPLWGLLKTLITAYFGAYKAVVVAVWGAIKTITTAVWGAIKGILIGAWTVIKTVATTEWGLIKGAILTPIRAVRDALGGKDGIWAKIHDTAVAAWDKIKGAVSGFAKSVKTGVLDGIKGGLNVLIGFVNDVISVINAIPGVPNIKKVAKLAEGGTVSKAGVQALAEGGVVRKPIVMMGEEAPRHPEYVIPTNPAYRSRAQMLLAQAAGAIGYQTGGIFNVAEMADLWRSKGGSASLADTMGTIGLVESGGNPNARNPSGASGLWQILGQLVPGNIFNPGVNALNAIAKYKSQGLSAWDASKSKWGPLIGKTSGIDLNPLSLIKQLPGVGDLPEWLKGTGKYILDKVGDYIKHAVSSVIPGGGGGGTSAGPAGIGTFEGLPMANWVIGALKYARRHGARGAPTSGYRSHAQNVAQGRLYTSEHEGTQYPHGAVDFGGFHSGFATKMAYVNATAGYKYPLLAPIGFTDDGHASGTGHRMGGILGQGEPFVGSYARGGRVPADGFGYLHQGETVVPRGASGPTINVEHMEVRNDMDIELFSRKLGWQLATGGA